MSEKSLKQQPPLQFVTAYQRHDILITNLPARIHTHGTLTLSIHTAFNSGEWYQLLRKTQAAKCPSC